MSLLPYSRPFVLSLAAVAAASAALVGSASAAPTPAALLARYDPLIQLDPLESFAPTTVEPFIADSQLEQLGSSGTWSVVDAHPRADTLPTSGAGQWRLNQRTCSAAAAVGGLDCYSAAWKAKSGPLSIYGRVVHEAGRIVLQYWLFYYDDVYSYTYPPIDFIWQAHEADWENVNVVLSNTAQPLYVGYSEHCLGARRTWRKTPRSASTHAIVHVAIGSHANYFSTGVHPINLRCIPEAAVALLRSRHLPLPLDFGFAGRHGAVLPIQQLGAQAPTWIGFPGYWGESQYFHAPPPIGSIAFGTSPVGPAFQAVWRDPLKTIASWPAG